jgi:hypothetical protein
MDPRDFFKNLTGVYGWAAERPGLMFGAGAAALAAPLFMKNDERGYFKTSTMTTPAIVAAAMVAPRLIPTAVSEGKRLIDVVKQVPTDYGFRDGVYQAATGAVNIAELRSAYEEGRISINEYLAGQSRFYAGLPIEEITSNQIEREFSALTSHFNRLYEDPTKHRLLENALFHAQLKQSGAADKLGWQGLTAVAPTMTANEMSDIIDANSKDIDWIREMNFRLREASEAKVAGEGAVVPQLKDLASTNAEFMTSESYAGRGRALLEEQHAALAQEINDLLKDSAAVKQYGYRAENIEVITLPAGRNRAINEIVGLRIDGDLTIPVIDGNGGIRLGSSFENSGVSRFFMQHGADVSADVYGVRGLRYGKDFVRDELSRAQFVVGRDPLNGNPFQADEAGVAQATRRQQQFYSNQGVFADMPGSFPVDGEDRGVWSRMRPERKVAEITHQVGSGGKIRTTGGTKIDTLEREETRLIEPMGVHNREKESLRIKSMNKSIWADVAEGHAGFSATDYTDLPEFGVHSLQITPSQRALFGDLPEWNQVAEAGFDSRLALEDSARALSLDMALSKIGAKQRAVGYIAMDAGVNEMIAADMWDRLLPFLSNRKNYEAMRNVGYIGEGARIMKKNVGAEAVRHVNYVVHENMLSEDLLKGGTFGRDQVLGMKYGTSMFAQGDSNRIINHSVNEADGTILLQVEERLGVQGMKTHNLGKQTVSRALEDVEMDRVIRGFNNYFKVSGQGGAVADEVDSVVLEQFNSAKANNPLQILNDSLGDTLRRLDGIYGAGNTPAFLTEAKFSGRSHLDRLAELGYSYENGRLITHTENLRDLQGSAADYTQAADYIRDLMNEVGARIKNKQIAGDRFMESYIDWSFKHEDGTYLEYLMQRALPESMSVSDHMALNHASRVGITRDALQQMSLAGEHETAREILSRLEADGSTGMTWDFMQHTDPSVRDFSKPFGDASVSIEEAVGDSLIDRLGTAEGRVMKVTGPDGKVAIKPTIFDPAHELAQKNYSIKTTVGGKDYFIPVLGREAYGGKANAHDLMGYSANKWENELRNVLQTANDVNEGFGTKVPFEDVLASYVQKVRESYGVGKEGVWRAPTIDPLGFEGRATARASTLRYADGSVNPFEIGVGKEYLDLMSKEHAEILRGGGRVQAISVRHPINAVVMADVRYDPNLNGSWQVGADPVMQRMMRMDADGDRLSFHMANTQAVKWAEDVADPAGLQGERAAEYARWQRFSEQINNPESLQGRLGAFRRVFEGDELNPRAYVKGSMTDVFSNVRKFAGRDLRKAIQARTAAADVGMLSNTFDLLETSMAHNDLFRDPFEKLITHEFSYDIVREASIAAAKLKGGGAYQDLTTLMAWNNSLRSALNDRSEKGMNRFITAMTEGAQNFGKEIAVNDAQKAFFKIADETAEINPYLEFAQQRRDLLEKLWRGHDSTVSEIQQIMTVTGENAAKYARRDIVTLFNNQVPAVQAFAHRGASDYSAATLGAENARTAAGKFAQKTGQAAEGVFNHAARSVEEVVQAARGTGAMKALGVGAAVAVGAGILFGSLRSPRKGQALAPSGNRFRPEEKIGVDGHVPGEPETGVMAPANPPRRIRPAQGGVRTAVVAPIGRTTELEVHMRADDRGRAAEASKIATRLAAPAGNSHVSITYRDTTRLDSLRTKERIREAMDER